MGIGALRRHYWRHHEATPAAPEPVAAASADNDALVAELMKQDPEFKAAMERLQKEAEDAQHAPAQPTDADQVPEPVEPEPEPEPVQEPAEPEPVESEDKE